MKPYCAGLLILLLFSGFADANDEGFLKKHPSLAPFVFQEPQSGFRFGFGLSPLEIVNSKTGISFSFFQVHWMNKWLDWEAFNASFGMTFAGSSTSNIRKFVFRSVPKYRLNEMISMGPLVGYEFTSFPDLDVRLEKEGQFTPIDSFSARDVIYGAAVSENFKFRERFHIKATQFAYRQTFSTSKTKEGWNYIFLDGNGNQQSSPVSAGWVFGLDFAILF